MTGAPLVIDLFAGLGGWAEGFLRAGWRVVGFDITRHVYGDLRYPGQLVLQDVLTLDGAQFRNADLIVASPPCQKYSWLAMPWSRSKSEHSQAAKALRRKWETEGPDNVLFDACFRIQREAMAAFCNCACWQCKAGGHCVRCDCHYNTGNYPRHIPMVVENVRGAQEWVGLSGPCADIPSGERWRRGRSRWHHGSFHLWGDVPALMPIAPKGAGGKFNPDGTNHGPGSWFAISDSVDRGQKTSGGSWFRERNGVPQPGIPHEERGLKIGGDWFSDPNSTCRRHGSKSRGRKMASAKIAKIPPAISEHFAEVFRPKNSGSLNENSEDGMQLNEGLLLKENRGERGGGLLHA